MVARRKVKKQSIRRKPSRRKGNHGGPKVTKFPIRHPREATKERNQRAVYKESPNGRAKQGISLPNGETQRREHKHLKRKR